jgi:hypothetical protein
VGGRTEHGARIAAAAGAVEFFERLFRDPSFVGVGQQLDAAAALLNRAARSRHKRPFARCAKQEQDAILQTFRRGEVQGRRFDGSLFMKRLVILTVESLFGDPRHGGNRGEVGWKLIGRQACHFAPRRLELALPDGRAKRR